MTRASAAAVVALAAACGGGPPKPATPAPTVLRTIPLADAFVLGSPGEPPRDTTVELRAGSPRHVLLRTPDPDNVVVVDAFFDSLAFQTPAGNAVHVTLRSLRDTTGFRIEADAPFQAGALVTLKYALHFAAPPESRARYPNANAFEQALAIGRVGAAGELVLLPSLRPAADNLRTTVTTSGTYLVAAPK